MKFLTCCTTLLGIALCFAVTPSQAGGRIIRTDNPGVACDLWSWSGDTNLSSDIYSTQDGNATSFSPGVPTSGPLNFCSPTMSLLEIWESPSQQNSTGNVEAFTDPANPASQPYTSGPGQGLPTDLYWTATNAFTYEWVDSTTPNTGENPQAALIVWTLPNTNDLEFEFQGPPGGAGGWCLNSASVATFTWLGNLYTANCSNFNGDDLLIDTQGLPDGYIGATDESFHSGLSTDWSVQYATQVLNQSSYEVPNNAPFVVSVQVTNKDDGAIGVGTVTLTSANPLTNLTSPVAASGYASFNIPANPTGLYTFTATYNPVAGQTFSSSSSIPMRVDPPVPTISINVSPASIDLGQSATLTWSTTNSTSCSASGAWSGAQSGSGSVKVTPSTVGSSIYTLYCLDSSSVTGTSSDWAAAATLTVVTPPAPTVTVTVTPSTITLGQTATLTWSSTFATSCTADSAWSGARAMSGSLAVTPTTAGGFAYSLTCTGAAGATGNGAAALVVSPTQPPPANAPTVTVTIAPGTITVGQSASLTWSSTNATSCTADSAWTGAQATSGTSSVSPSSAGGYAYSLSCTGTGGTTNGAVGLSVTPAPPPQSDIPTVTITVSPSTITVGQSATLTWSSTNATGCTSDSAWTGARATSGTLSVTPSAAGGYAYSLSCSGAAGVGNGAVGLSVVPVATSDPTPAPPSKSGGGGVSLWELVALAALLGRRLRRGDRPIVR